MTRRTAPFSAEALWQLARIGAPSLSPDGSQAVAAVTRYDMEENQGRSSLYLFSTLGGEPRRLTEAGEKDSQPQWSPAGDAIAFVAQRVQGSVQDETPQLYLIAPDGGEARRIAQVPTGVEAFRWFPDGRRIAFISWVWPEHRTMAAQGRAHKAFKARKESAYVTDELLYRHWDHHIPQGRVPHVLVMDVATGKVRDLMAGSSRSLDWKEPGAQSFCISPDGRFIVFAFDPAEEKRAENGFALAELSVRTGRQRVLLQAEGWDFDAPCYSHGAQHLAFIATHRGATHTAPAQLAVLDTQGHWAVLSADWDREVQAPVLWREDDLALRFASEDQGRSHLIEFDLTTRQPRRLFEGGHVGAFDALAGSVVVLHDSVQFPPRLSTLTTDTPRRIEQLNDAALARHQFGAHEEIWVKGSQGDEVQMWLVFPPEFDAKRRKKWPVMHVIHGGPHTAFGDSWHWRWNHQVFAAQGKVVACVNYHGSSSFGHAFKDSISGHWGKLELQDVEAGTNWLIRQRWCDKSRVTATGGSYGGYMVAWMNGHVKPGRYRAYVCHAGCFDWSAMFATDGYTWFPLELGSTYWDDPAKVAAQSPHAFAHNMGTPTLVVHGQLDYRVPDAQGLAYYNTLKARGVPARLVWFPDENHWVLKPRNSRLWYREFFNWIDRFGG